MRRRMAWSLPLLFVIVVGGGALEVRRARKSGELAHRHADSKLALEKALQKERIVRELALREAKAVPTEYPPPRATAAPPPLPPGVSARYLAIGGGSFPESSEVSLEQNLELVHDVLAGPGIVLFGGGPGSYSVREQDGEDAPDGLLQRLGDVFLPRNGRRSRYRASSLQAGTASLAEVEAQLTAALHTGTDPLLLFIATHGDQGEHAADNQVLLWGSDGLTPARLAELHEATPRPLRAIVASCFSGGFSELAFAHADEHAGPTRAPRCGLFAGTWDRETSGCDPDPERRNQEGYSLHVLQALRGRDRAGAKLPPRDLDYDGDGRVSLLEAHVWASIAGQSIDVPTTTSERYLRAVQTRPGPSQPALLPEYAALVARLGARLGLDGEAQARARWQGLDQRLGELDQRVAAANDELDARYGALAGRLLARWPILDDPYHAEFAAIVARDHAELDAALHEWPEARAYTTADDAVAELEDTRSAVEVEEAVVLRLVRAYETLGLASALHARGGAQWAAYSALLGCERYVPELAPSQPVDATR